ncbi:hypothetical protein BDV98DRAFT_614383 [Pterulicium gracile]|uniref:Uncharacterized protein n=1 Tax=Pterulicium gracile TaxID=1884261 RepID=A0A5C3Q8N1_9AGAR|nr:hypothetical protein BDV98DRAFT_614383 [Pterula gracilis]
MDVQQPLKKKGVERGALFARQVFDHTFLLTKQFKLMFEKKHPGCIAVVLVNHFQGHSTFADDALQLCLRNGLFKQASDGTCVSQSMVFSNDHEVVELSGRPKGMKQVLVEQGLFCSNLWKKCSKDDYCANAATDCYFKEQCGLIQKILEKKDMPQMYLSPPKYHCKINLIEYFWGALKRYLRKHCHYLFPGLKKDIPAALASIRVETIHKWKHQA